jgi:8-oxo-dGTP diphosphatase
MIKRYGSAPENGQQYILRPGAYAILPRGGDILLTYQGNPHHEYQLPGGGIDPGESPLQALHREVFEETGWRIANPRKIGTFRRFVYMPDYKIHAEKICHIYCAHPVRPHGPPREADHSAVWLPRYVAIDVVANDGDAAFLAILR